jgi:hypothetical protein
MVRSSRQALFPEVIPPRSTERGWRPPPVRSSAASSVGALVRAAATVALMMYGYCPVPVVHAATRRDEAAAVGTPHERHSTRTRHSPVGPVPRRHMYVRHARLDGQSPMAGESLRVLHPQAGSMTTSGVDTDPRWPLPRGLIVVLSMTGILVTVLALKQFAGIIAPVLLAFVLVICFYPLIGILRRRGAPQWLAVTVTLIALVVVILGLAAALALSVAQLATILPTYQAQFTHLTDELRAWLGSLGVGTDQVKAAISKINFSSVAGLLGDLLASLAGVFSNMLLLLFVVAFMALDAVRFPDGSPWPGRSDPRSSARSTASSLVPGPTCWSRRYSGLSWRSSTLASSGGSGCHYRCCGGCSRSSPTTSPTSGSSSV